MLQKKRLAERKKRQRLASLTSELFTNLGDETDKLGKTISTLSSLLVKAHTGGEMNRTLKPVGANVRQAMEAVISSKSLLDTAAMLMQKLHKTGHISVQYEDENDVED